MLASKKLGVMGGIEGQLDVLATVCDSSCNSDGFQTCLYVLLCVVVVLVVGVGVDDSTTHAHAHMHIHIAYPIP